MPDNIEWSVMKVLVTGSQGLIGRHLAPALTEEGIEVVAFDKLLSDSDGRPFDTRNRDQVAAAIAGCRGVIHLAAVSRVVWCEHDPDLCQQVNVEGTRNVYDAVMASDHRPFLLFASSREAYGSPTSTPVSEDCPLVPCNVYGRSKLEGELLTNALSAAGVTTSILRFSNVYGCTADHVDRVIPAFARQAARGGAIYIEGSECVFDFTHVHDVVSSIVQAVLQLADGRNLPAMHLASGTGTSLGQLAQLALDASGNRLEIVEKPPRSFDVSHFIGNAALATEYLDWSPKCDLATGFHRLTEDFRREDKQRV